MIDLRHSQARIFKKMNLTTSVGVRSRVKVDRRFPRGETILVVDLTDLPRKAMEVDQSDEMKEGEGNG